MRIREKIREKRRSKATKEVNVVIDCQIKNKKKLEELRSKIRAQKARADLLMEKGRGLDREEQIRIASEIKLIRDGLKIMEQDEKGYQAIDGLFGQLIPLLKSFHDKERFQYIIKMIPEKDLPQMINDSKRIGEVYDLLQKIFKKFYEEAERLLSILKNVDERERLEEKAHENFMENNRVEDKGLQDILEEMNPENKDETADVEKPQKHTV